MKSVSQFESKQPRTVNPDASKFRNAPVKLPQYQNQTKHLFVKSVGKSVGNHDQTRDQTKIENDDQSLACSESEISPKSSFCFVIQEEGKPSSKMLNPEQDEVVLTTSPLMGDRFATVAINKRSLPPALVKPDLDPVSKLMKESFSKKLESEMLLNNLRFCKRKALEISESESVVPRFDGDQRAKVINWMTRMQE